MKDNFIKPSKINRARKLQIFLAKITDYSSTMGLKNLNLNRQQRTLRLQLDVG